MRFWNPTTLLVWENGQNIQNLDQNGNIARKRWGDAGWGDIINQGFRIGRDSIGFCWSSLGISGPSQGPTKAVWALTEAYLHRLGPKWPFLGLDSYFSRKMANFHRTGPIPAEPGSKCAIFMSQTICDNYPQFLRFFKKKVIFDPIGPFPMTRGFGVPKSH